jgi:hypothetical protein
MTAVVAADFMTGGAPMAAEVYDRKGVVVDTFARREEDSLAAFRERVREASPEDGERIVGLLNGLRAA